MKALFGARAQHYAQCELLPRGGACSPDTKAASQFQHQQFQQHEVPAMAK